MSVPQIKRSVHRYRQYAKLLACCVATLILDMLANFILFCIQQDEFESWCHTKAKDHLNLQFQNNDVLDQSSSAVMFNCSKLFRVEAEFSFACMVLIMIVYVKLCNRMKAKGFTNIIFNYLGVLGFVYHQGI